MARYGFVQPWAGPRGASLDQLRREMDAALNRFGSPSAATASGRGVFPPGNLYETPDAYVLTAELPGVEPGDIQVSLEGSTVSLRGERRIDYPTGDQVNLHRRERQAGSFRRAFELPGAIEADKVEAVHRHGLLMLRLPKTPEAQPRKIAVQNG